MQLFGSEIILKQPPKDSETSEWNSDCGFQYLIILYR